MMSYSYYLTAILFLFIFISCGSDSTVDACDASSYDKEIPAIIMSFTTALQNYGTDPSDENCQSLRSEYSAYLNFLKNYEECPFTFNGGELKDAISQGEMDIDDLPCS